MEGRESKRELRREKHGGGGGGVAEETVKWWIGVAWLFL